ncbi:hypothetical protein [Nocardia sp. NPDC020380]|uniref:hypothetical protein n=1 Tax=Nocardia sp. NPDC020380 TaxID=3364309 RepID=UPI0037972A6A
MSDIPGARDELHRLGGILRTQLVELITALTPAADLRLLFLNDPTVADWSEPPRYHYSVVFRGERPAGVTAAALAEHAASLLGSGGWAVTTSERIAGEQRRLVVAGSREGIGIEIRTGENNSGVMYEAATPALVLETSDFQRPDPVRTSETVTPGYVLCYECDGLGWCPECGGRGWLAGPDGKRRRCPECNSERVCPICRGGGELAISQLQPFQRDFYPELRRAPE